MMSCLVGVFLKNAMVAEVVSIILWLLTWFFLVFFFLGKFE